MKKLVILVSIKEKSKKQFKKDVFEQLKKKGYFKNDKNGHFLTSR